jgi:hypothetical protein
MRTTSSRVRGGFTLAEAAITIAVVGIALSYTMKSLNNATFTAAQTRNVRLARELGMMTLGEISAGVWWDDIEMTRTGSYAGQDHADYYFEIALGDEQFSESADDGTERPFDNWAYREEQRREAEDYDEDAESEEVQPYEKVRIKIQFPKLLEFEHEITLERWIPWAQVYGPDDEALTTDEAAESDAGDEGG